MAPEKAADQNGKVEAQSVPNGTRSASFRRKSSAADDIPRERHESEDSDESLESYADYIPTPPDGGWGWVIVFASVLNNVIVDGIGYSFGVFLGAFSEYFQQPKSKVSLVGSLLCGVYMIAGPIVSAMTNKFGCRPVVIAGSIVASVSFLLSMMATSVEILMVTYGVMAGFGFGMIYLPSIVSVGYYFEKKRALATGIAVCGSGIGTFIFAPFSEFLLTEMDWKRALMIVSGITLHSAICGMLMRPLMPTKRDHRPRAKNLLDRIKEQTKGTRNRGISESSTYAYNARDTNSILQRVMQAKLLRERNLQDDESELGSLPSIFFVKSMIRKDSSHRDPRVHKLSISDRGEAASYLGSPGDLPVVMEQGSEMSPPPESTAHEGRNFPYRRNSAAASAQAAASRKLSLNCGEDVNVTHAGEIANLDEVAEDVDLGSGGEDVLLQDDAETTSMFGTEKSVYFTPPTSPVDGSFPSSPEKEGESQVHVNKVDDAEDDNEADAMAAPQKDSKILSVPSSVQHHVREVIPLLKVTGSKNTVVTLGSERSIWRHHPSRTALGPNLNKPPITSLHSLNVSKKDLARPLYRKDIFYSGSIMHIPEYHSQVDMRSYLTSFTTIPGEMEYFGEECKLLSYCTCLPQSSRDTLATMMDCSLLKDLGFMLICIGNVLTFLGFYVPFVYIVDLAVSFNIDKSQAAFLISVIGITNTVGRVLTGWLADMRKINSLVITYVSIFVCGVATAAFPLCNSFGALSAAAAIFGLSVAAFISLSSILICDLLGLEKLTNGFGLMTLFRGLAAMAGPPLAGFIFDQTKTYDASFYLGGGLLVLGSLFHAALKLPCISKVQRVPVNVDEAGGVPLDDAIDFSEQPEIISIEEIQTVP